MTVLIDSAISRDTNNRFVVCYIELTTKSQRVLRFSSNIGAHGMSKTCNLSKPVIYILILFSLLCLSFPPLLLVSKSVLRHQALRDIKPKKKASAGHWPTEILFQKYSIKTCLAGVFDFKFPKIPVGKKKITSRFKRSVGLEIFLLRKFRKCSPIFPELISSNESVPSLLRWHTSHVTQSDKLVGMV